MITSRRSKTGSTRVAIDGPIGLAVLGGVALIQAAALPFVAALALARACGSVGRTRQRVATAESNHEPPIRR